MMLCVIMTYFSVGRGRITARIYLLQYGVHADPDSRIRMNFRLRDSTVDDCKDIARMLMVRKIQNLKLLFLCFVLNINIWLNNYR